MNPFLLIGAAVGFRFAPQIVSRLNQLPRPHFDQYEERFSWGGQSRGVTVTWFSRAITLNYWKGGDS